MSSTGINKELYCDYAIFYNNVTCLSDINVSGCQYLIIYQVVQLQQI